MLGMNNRGGPTLNLLCNSSFKDPWKVFKNTFLLTGTRENVTDPACVRELVCVCVCVCVCLSVYKLEWVCMRWMHVEEAAQIEIFNSHVWEGW